MNISTEQYLSAMSDALSTKQIGILKLLYEQPGFSATASRLSLLMNSSYDGHIVANSAIGKIGKTIAEYLSIQPENYFDGRKSSPAYFNLIGPYDTDYGWKMNPNLAEAMHQYIHSAGRNTYLLTWNPKRWEWTNIEADIKKLSLLSD